VAPALPDAAFKVRGLGIVSPGIRRSRDSPVRAIDIREGEALIRAAVVLTLL